MAIRTILEVPDPRLKRISRPVESFDDELRTLVDDMFETMYDAPGIGLAAIQVDVPLRVVVVDLQDGGEAVAEPEDEEAEQPERVPNPRVFINPELVDPSPVNPLPARNIFPAPTLLQTKVVIAYRDRFCPKEDV